MNWRAALSIIPGFKAVEPVKALPPWYQNTIVLAALGLSLAVYLFENYVSLRQYFRLHQKDIPASIKTIIKPDEFEKARLYSLDKCSFGLLVGAIDFVLEIYILIALYPILWSYSGTVSAKYLSAASEIHQSLVFGGLLMVLSTIISIPSSLYMTFVIEARHGFNKQTIGLFFGDLVKSLILGSVFGGVALAATISIVRRFGDKFVVALWLFIMGLQFFLLLIFPTFIQPLFNKFEPLAEGSLKSKIEALARRLSFPLSKIFVMDGSKRSSHSNAYFFGFISKRIVIFDTLMAQNTEDEICAVLGHELGHWKHGHTWQMLIFSQLQIIGLFYAFSHFYRNEKIFEAFGYGNQQPVLIGLLLFAAFYKPINLVVSFLLHLLSRHNEFQADRFSVSLGYGKLLQSSLTKLQIENKGNMNPDWLYSALHYQHPPLVQRLEAIDAAMRKNN